MKCRIDNMMLNDLNNDTKVFYKVIAVKDMTYWQMYKLDQLEKC